jgi:hypothetical protein
VISQMRVHSALILPPRASVAGAVLPSPSRRREARLRQDRTVLAARAILVAALVALLCALAFLAGSR